MYKLLTTAAMLAMAAAASAETGPYIGVDYVRTETKYQDLHSFGNKNGSEIFGKKSNGVSPYVGMQLTDRIAVEAAYLDTGYAKKNNVNGSKTNTRFKVRGASADLVGGIPLTETNSLVALGSAGVGRYTAKVKASGPGISGGGDQNDTAYRLGAGAQYQLTDSLGVRAMARYIDVDFDDTVKNMVTGSVGLNYRF